MSDKSYISDARDVFEVEIQALRNVSDQLDGEFENLVCECLTVLGNGGKLVLSGIGKSGHIGQKLAATLSSTGSTAVFMHPIEAMHGDLGMLSSGDLLIALSYSGETEELLDVLPAAKRLGVRIMSLTGSRESRLSQWSDLTVCMAVDKEACPFNLAPTATTTALLALGDALAIVLMKARRFEQKDYAMLHPSGAIGRSITLSVTDIMRKEDRFPKVAPDATVSEALMEMTRARSGSVAVVGEDHSLRGIFTDGDFRRCIMKDPSIMTAKVITVATESPVTINSGSMAVEILKLLENRHVDDIIVVDSQGKAVGLVDIQDLPQFKVM